MKKIIFETDRLVVRRIRNSDLPVLLEMSNNPKVMKYISLYGFNPTSAQLELDGIKRQKKYYKSNPGFGLWMIDDDKGPVGWVSLKYNHDIKSYELGYRLNEKDWYQGYATEVCQSLKGYAKSMAVKEISAVILPDNKASIGVVRKMGMNFKEEQFKCSKRVEVYQLHL